jgi:FkbM family methyltransferase
MNVRIFLRDKIFFPLIDLLPHTLKIKLKMAGTCCFGSGWSYLFFGLHVDNFETLSEKDIGDLYSELSAYSLMVLQRYLRYCHFVNMCRKSVITAQHGSIIVPLKNMFPGIKAKIAFEAKTCRKFAKRTCFKTFSPEAGCYHHGLTCVEPDILSYIKNSVFLDLGAYNGDSSFVFSKYEPEKILAFEPSVVNGNLFVENMKKSRINNVELIRAGVSDKPDVMRLVEKGYSAQLSENDGYPVDVVTIDGFLKQHPCSKIRLIKADLEGMGLKMLKGAIETIKKKSPCFADFCVS